MDQRETQFQSLNICHKLFRLTKLFVSHAHKKVISGRLMPRRMGQAPAKAKEGSSNSSQQVHPMAETTTSAPRRKGEQAKTSSNDQDKGRDHASEIEEIGASNAAADAYSEEDKKPEEEEATLPSNSSLPTALKKMVSINENVETINKSKKKKNKKKKEQVILDEQKPLKSILKVPSIDGQSHSLIN